MPRGPAFSNIAPRNLRLAGCNWVWFVGLAQRISLFQQAATCSLANNWAVSENLLAHWHEFAIKRIWQAKFRGHSNIILRQAMGKRVHPISGFARCSGGREAVGKDASAAGLDVRLSGLDPKVSHGWGERVIVGYRGTQQSGQLTWTFQSVVWFRRMGKWQTKSHPVAAPA